MARRSYTPDEKADALAAYAEHGPTWVAENLGIPASTVVGWARTEGVRTMRNERTAAAVEAVVVDRELQRERLRVLLLDKAVDLLGRMDEVHIDYRGKDCEKVTFPKAPADACKSYAVAAAVLVDKLRLELGEATARTEHTLTDSIDAEVAKLTQALAANDPQPVDA